MFDLDLIKTLSPLEHIRLRTGMYIGRIGDGSHYDDGPYILVKEVIDNCIDEFIMGYGREVQLAIEGNRVSVRDFGRGIPLGKVIDCVSQINTGAKYNDDVFQFSVGLNGVGTKAVNALSKEFFVRSHRAGECVEAAEVAFDGTADAPLRLSASIWRHALPEDHVQQVAGAVEGKFARPSLDLVHRPIALTNLPQVAQRGVEAVHRVVDRVDAEAASHDLLGQQLGERAGRRRVRDALREPFRLRLRGLRSHVRRG